SACLSDRDLDGAERGKDSNLVIAAKKSRMHLGQDLGMHEADGQQRRVPIGPNLVPGAELPTSLGQHPKPRRARRLGEIWHDQACALKPGERFCDGELNLPLNGLRPTRCAAGDLENWIDEFALVEG